MRTALAGDDDGMEDEFERCRVAAARALADFAEGLRAGLAPALAAMRTRSSCFLVPDNDMEAAATRYNRWYQRAHPPPLDVDGHAYRRRQLARRHRKT